MNGGYTERFYYVKSDGENSILIYNKSLAISAYDLSGENWHGPRDGYKYLPSISVWDNPKIISPGTRNILAKNGSNTTAGGTIENFTYTGKAARFLTFQEVQESCNRTILGSMGNLDGCNWLLENVSLYEKGTFEEYGYWLETPNENDASTVFEVIGARSVYSNGSNIGDLFAVRPVITVKTSDLG